MGRRPKRNYVESKMVRNLDELSRYEEFRQNIAPALQKDIQEGKTAQEILDKYKALVAARVIQAALLEPDHAKAAMASEKVLDRTLGKPPQKQEISGTLTTMSDSELDALLASKLAESSEDDLADEQH